MAINTTKGMEAQGVVISYSDGGSPSAFTAIGNVTSFSGPGGAASVIDVTNLDSTAKEKMMGLPDEGQFTMDVNYHADNASHIALRAARVARSRLEFQVALTDATSTHLIFFGYVLGFQIKGAIDDKITASITIEIDGPVASV